VYLDFDAGFAGHEDTKARNAVMRVLNDIPEDTCVVIIDSRATSRRKKTFSALGKHQHLPTPRFRALTQWIQNELVTNKIRFGRNVPDSLAELFGQDLGSIAGEIQKMAVLNEEVSRERVYALANRSITHNAFELIESTVDGDVSRSLTICQRLLRDGEDPARILGALNWQYTLVARCVGLKESYDTIDPDLASRALKVKPFAAKKALTISRRLDESRLIRLLEGLLNADVSLKIGGNPRWVLDELIIGMATLFSEC
jgi:DNA polymerase-3 subunit delta